MLCHCPREIPANTRCDVCGFFAEVPYVNLYPRVESERVSAPEPETAPEPAETEPETQPEPVEEPEAAEPSSE